MGKRKSKRTGSSLQSKVKQITGGGGHGSLMSPGNVQKFCRSMKLGKK
jgi:hypothetical protein